MIATFQPKSPYKRIIATSLIIGAAIKNEKVTPNGTPASTNPKNNGIAEQEQNGVTIPNIAAKTFPVKVFLPSKAFLVFSGVKNVRIIPTKNIINANNNITFGTSKMKNRIASVKCSPFDNLKISPTKKSVMGCK